MSESVDSNQNSDDDVKDSPQEIAKPIEPIAQKSKNKKQHKPIHSTQIHVSGHKNAFTYQLPNGKRKVDQSLKRFCTQHKCIGVFEVKLHLKQFGFKLNNVNKIKYDANDNGVSLKYDSVRDGFDVFINYPSNITIKVLRNPKAICVGNKVLLCRIPITSHNLTLRSYNPHKQPKLGVIGGKKQRKWNDKMTAKLQRNHQQINQNKTKLTGFQRSLYGIPSEKHKTF